MIRAIFRDGKIQPLDPSPAEWEEGRKLQIVETEPSDDLEEIDRWWKEFNDLRNQPHDPAEWQKLEAALDEADRLAKDQGRKEMGLD